MRTVLDRAGNSPYNGSAAQRRISMVSMKDVSRHAGVSVATVSNVITGKRQVSESVRRRVLDSIAALNYQVNLVARGLKTQRTSTIGLILPDITKLFFQRVITGILTEASQMGYRLNILNSGYDFQTERTLINTLRASRVDGIILDSCVNRENAAQWAEELQRGGQGAQPVVSLENTLYSQSVSSVTLDCALYSGMITQHLFDLGRRRVLYVAGPLSIEHEYDRLRGYRECHEKNGLQAAAEMEKHGGYLSESGYVAVREALAAGLRFDAVQASSDQAAIGALKALHECGLRVPEDVAVCGFDNLFPASLVSPAVTTVDVPNFEMGRLAVRELIECIENPERPPCCRRVEAKLVVRASSLAQTPSNWDLDGW